MSKILEYYYANFPKLKLEVESQFPQQVLTKYYTFFVPIPNLPDDIFVILKKNKFFMENLQNFYKIMEISNAFYRRLFNHYFGANFTLPYCSYIEEKYYYSDPAKSFCKNSTHRIYCSEHESVHSY